MQPMEEGDARQIHSPKMTQFMVETRKLKRIQKQDKGDAVREGTDRKEMYRQ